jgi:hypothetical protein
VVKIFLLGHLTNKKKQRQARMDASLAGGRIVRSALSPNVADETAVMTGGIHDKRGWSWWWWWWEGADEVQAGTGTCHVQVPPMYLVFF